MAQVLERPRSRRPFARMDILAQMGETICLTVEPPAPVRREVPARLATPVPTASRALDDEEPERWDGLS
jgi:hypothetical protein